MDIHVSTLCRTHLYTYTHLHKIPSHIVGHEWLYEGNATYADFTLIRNPPDSMPPEAF